MLLKLQVIGHLGRDAEVKDINEKNVIDFSVAHTEKYMSQGMQTERTTWVNCSYWTDKTGIAQYLRKGQLVYVEGTPNVDTYQNKENQTVAVLRLRVINVRLLGGRVQDQDANATAQPPQHNTATSSTTANNSTDDDDLPF